MPLLEIRNLSVDFATASGKFRAVDSVDVSVDTGEILAIVGESGSGKSVSMLALMGLLPWTATVTADVVSFGGQDLRQVSARQRRRILGKDMAMIFQEPMSSLNPCFTTGFQIREALRQHPDLSAAEHQDRAIDVQYAGQNVEEQSVEALFETPRHPYSAALFAALPERATSRHLPTIPGVVPGQFGRPKGRLFSPRCKFTDERCRTTPPLPAGSDKGRVRRHYPLGATTEALA